ncbi:MAG TPA: HAD-IB family phosphatase [Candidatus Acidoferrum sp.]|nr:HAD-IB family phosphatase [Candidatus Acidoferrum sp.]
MNARNRSGDSGNFADSEIGAPGDAREPADIAAFFDLDGTLLSLPSLETRFFRSLRHRRVIRLGNYLRWLAEAARLFPRGLKQIWHANKMYLHGVSISEAASSFPRLPDAPRTFVKPRPGERHGRKHIPEMPPSFYPEALARFAWHAKHGHALVIVSGTLQPLAMSVAAALEEWLVSIGSGAAIGVYATRLEARGSRWTGGIAGEAMFGEAKALAVKQIAESRRFDLAKCFAYGDSANDRAMLEAVGRPAAVNPSNDLARIANRQGWPILRWGPGSRGGANSSCAPEDQSMQTSRERLRMTRSKSGIRP